MKYTREFRFLPNFRAYNYRPGGHDVEYILLPSFNCIANFLESKGWEIVDYEKIESNLSDTHSLPEEVRYGLLIHAISYDKPKEDEKYVYIANKEGGLEEYDIT